MLDIERWWDYGDKEAYTARQIKTDCERVCDYMLNYKCSIRQASQELCIPKSRIHWLIHTYIEEYYNEEYHQIVKLLRFNKKYRSKPRKSWRGSPW